MIRFFFASSKVASMRRLVMRVESAFWAPGKIYQRCWRQKKGICLKALNKFHLIFGRLIPTDDDAWTFPVIMLIAGIWKLRTLPFSKSRSEAIYSELFRNNSITKHFLRVKTSSKSSMGWKIIFPVVILIKWTSLDAYTTWQNFIRWLIKS